MKSRISQGYVHLAALLILFAVCTIRINAQAGWTPNPVGVGGLDLNTVYFLDSKRGWVAGDGGFLSRTDDGGRTWAKQTVGTRNAINDIYFRSKEDGFLLAGNTIFMTHDSGNSWFEARKFLPSELLGGTAELYSVRFSSKKKGWVVGSVSKNDFVIDSILVYTEDAGETWTRQRAPSRAELIHLDFVDDKHGWIVGAEGAIIYTFDAGRSWNSQNSGTRAMLYHIDFRDEKNGWAVGEKGTVLRTSDAGQSWLPVDSKARSTLLSVQFVNDDEGWIVGRGGMIMRSEDSGRTWVHQESGTKQNLYALIFQKKIGWAVGGDAIVLRYDR
ncbi:MAG TPA: YCF48-related protein [Pyrinomonadaceae bacterium]|jgi:photosystem II stability/assembly factor-like uncharacterized protein|nr:YCF48-related protein [Pyrinomonadaceae bacterium]